MGIGETAAGTALGMGLSMATRDWSDKKQYHQQKRLQKLQIRGDKELGLFNQKLALDTWDKTNYEAQREHMEKAGLNVGLMYGGAGAGATTSGGSAGNVTGGNAPAGGGEVGMGMQLGMQMQLLKAQKENIEADTANKQADTANKPLQGANVAAGTINIAQQTTNAQLQNTLMGLEAQLKKLEINKEGATQPEVIQQARILTEKIKDEARSARVKGDIDEATENNIIRSAELANQATVAGISATQTGIEATKVGMEATKAGTEQTKQKTENLKTEQVTQELQNELRKNGIEPNDSAPMRIISRVITNTGTSLKKIQTKMSEIIKWLKGQNGSQTEERFNEIWNQ